MSPLVWAMFGLGIAGSLVACDNWMSRFFFAWSMVFAYLFFFGILTVATVMGLIALGIEGDAVERLVMQVIAGGLLCLYGLQIYCMRGRVSGVGGGARGGNGSPRNPFKKSYS